MSSDGSKIQLEFYNTSLTGNEAQISEKMGMLLLASDFIGSSRVGRADKLERISKANISILISKTKSGDYIAINPFSSAPLKVKMTQLPTMQSITEYVGDPSNLDLNKLRSKMLKFDKKDTEILGGFSKKDLQVVEKLLQAPKSSRKDFTQLQAIRDLGEINEDINSVNQLVYDDKTLEKEIKERLDIIEKPSRKK